MDPCPRARSNTRAILQKLQSYVGRRKGSEKRSCRWRRCFLEIEEQQNAVQLEIEEILAEQCGESPRLRPGVAAVLEHQCG